MKTGVWEAVMERDRMCVLAKLEPGHQCRTVYGTPHAPHEFLTYEHVKEHLAGVALCGAANNRPPTKAQREMFRAYLARFYGERVA